MDPKSLIKSTFKGVTYFEAPCLPGTKLCLDAADIEEDESDLNEFVEAFGKFLKLTPEDLLKAEPYLFSIYKEFEREVDSSCLTVKISDQNQIWQELEFRDVNLLIGGGKIYVQLAAECSWDAEHGIQLIFRGGNQLSRISEQDGHCTPDNILE